MNSSSFMRADGALDQPRPAWWSAWLPTFRQVQQAIQVSINTEAGALTVADGSNLTITMRQGLGLVVVAALLAGLLPFLFNCVLAIRTGTILPLALLAERAQEWSVESAPLSQMGETFQNLAGLPPLLLPRWMAALLSAVGEWINWPLRWLTWWLVYGTGVLLAAKVWGVSTTLQRFFAGTSYAAVPMILTGLGPVPCLGIVAQIVAVVWMFVIYSACVQAVTGLTWARVLAAVILPAAIAALLGFILLLAATATGMRLLF